MEQLTLGTPSLLFSAVSLIMLAYTNRFLSYAQIVRSLKEQYDKHPSEMGAAQIENLRKRLYLIRTMQLLGIASLLLSVLCTLFIYIGWQTIAIAIFGGALLSLIASLSVSIGEIVISVRALEVHLSVMESNKERKEKKIAENAHLATSEVGNIQKKKEE